jgi:hypothetical protein
VLPGNAQIGFLFFRFGFAVFGSLDVAVRSAFGLAQAHHRTCRVPFLAEFEATASARIVLGKRN